MLGTMDVVVLYVAVAAVICGFLAVAAWMLKMQGVNEGMKMQMNHGIQPSKPWPRHDGTIEWGPPGVGKVFSTAKMYKDEAVAGVLRVQWSYTSAYNKDHTVFFDDPADAYEYVVRALMSKNRMLDRLESQTYFGKAANYECLVIDTHIDREYWLDNLKEFKEDY